MNQTTSRSLTVLSLCAASVVAGVAWRSANARGTEAEALLAPQKPTAVGVVDWEDVVKNSKEVKDGLELLKSQEKDFQAKVDALRATFEKLKKDVEAMKDGPTIDRLRVTQEALIAQAQLNATAGTSQQILEVQGGDLMRKAFEHMVAAADKLQTQDGWDMILIDDRKLAPPERFPDAEGKEGARPTMREVQQIIQRRHILSAAKRVDVTKEITDLMNAEYAKPSAPPAKPASKK